MSDNLLKLIPVDENFMPSDVAQHEAAKLLKSFVSKADEVFVTENSEIMFIDPGENLEEIFCPECGSKLDDHWWKQAMDIAYQTKFKELDVTLPCCNTRSSLNQLIYKWPAGFARFVLVARNPETNINDEQTILLEKTLGCNLKSIWARY
jgi:hypothetical protein